MFAREREDRYRDSTKDLDILRDFLAQQGSPDEAKKEAHALKEDTGRKWGSHKIGDRDMKVEWIDKIMTNIDSFVKVGNYTMVGAPESVGLAWFAVKLTLSAIHSNYDLYVFFGAGLTDISEMMIIIAHYDRLYDERKRHKAALPGKESPVVESLFRNIIEAYVAVLSFSLSVRRHISAGTLVKLTHGFKDFLGTSKGRFQAKIDKINAAKKNIIEESNAIFQDKSMQHLESMQSIMSDIQSTVNGIKSFQSRMQEMKMTQEEQSQKFDVMLKKTDDIKATTKPRTPWDVALQEFEKNKEALNPHKTSDAWAPAIDQRHPDTCQWIFGDDAYVKWRTSTGRSMLCLTGQQGSGKSTVLATIIERLGVVDETKSMLLYFT